MAPHFRLRFLGAIQLEREGKLVRGFRSQKALALLGYLAGHTRPVAREHLVDLFWETKPEAAGRANLSWVLHQLSAQLPDCLLADRHSVQLQRSEASWLDTDALESLAARGDLASLATAAELYRGEFLAGVSLKDCREFDLWLLAERERWRQRAAGVLETLIVHASQCGEPAEALRLARRLLALEPWQEGAQRQVMRLLARQGQYPAALAQYEACRRTLAQELEVEPMAETILLRDRIQAAIALRPQPLPPQPTPFVGREKELEQITRLLDAPTCRLIALVGPGGSGKTRLALQAAQARRDAFLEGVYVVPLAAIGAPEYLASAIAEAVHFSFFGAQAPQTQLLNFLRGKEVLLVLDSLEHLLEGAGLLVKILEQAAEVKLLVTSRERLNLRWEWCFELGGLDYPAGDTAHGQPLDTYSAVRLFQQAARQARGQFSPAEGDLPAVARICQLVEGMPLGLELAGAGIRAHPCSVIAQEIERNLSFLAAPLRDAPERHQSLQATFEHSWRLLSPAEQRVFGYLSVFERGFDQAAANDVAGASPAGLQALADKSLLRRSAPDRYEWHTLLRHYAAQKLAAQPAAQAAARDRHSAHYAAFLHGQVIPLTHDGVAQALAAIRFEIENVRAMWEWAVAQARMEDLEASLISLSRFYALAGPFQEGEKLIGAAIDRLRPAAQDAAHPAPAVRRVLGKLLVEQARLLTGLGQCDQARASAQQSLALTEGVDQALGHLLWGQALWNQRDYPAAQAQFEQALALAQAAQSPQVEADCLHSLGLIAWHLSHYARARAFFEQALTRYRALADRKGESDALRSFGCVCGVQSDHIHARGYFEQALSMLDEIGHRHGQSIVLVDLGLVANQLGDYASARGYYRRGLQMAREIGDRPGEALALINLGYMSDQLGDYAGAQADYQQSRALYNVIGDRQGESLALACQALLLHHRGDNASACDCGRQALDMTRAIGNRYVEGYALTRLGHAFVELNQLERAAQAYQQAVTLRRELGEHGRAIESLAGLARVALAQTKVSLAQAYTEEILAHLDRHPLEGVDEPLRIHLTCYHVLAASQDARAPDILGTAYRLLQQRAGEIHEAPLRRSFLENVAAHREIVKLALGAGRHPGAGAKPETAALS